MICSCDERDGLIALKSPWRRVGTGRGSRLVKVESNRIRIGIVSIATGVRWPSRHLIVDSAAAAELQEGNRARVLHVMFISIRLHVVEPAITARRVFERRAGRRWARITDQPVPDAFARVAQDAIFCSEMQMPSVMTMAIFIVDAPVGALVPTFRSRTGGGVVPADVIESSAVRSKVKQVVSKSVGVPVVITAGRLGSEGAVAGNGNHVPVNRIVLVALFVSTDRLLRVSS